MMEPHEIEKRLDWLDEQRRKDSETISRLKRKLEESDEKLSKESAQIKDLADEVARLAGLTTRIHQMDETLAKHRKEVSRQLTEAEERRSAKEQQLGEVRKTDQKNIAKSLDDIRVDLGKLDAISSELDQRREEDIRITRHLDDLNKAHDSLSGRDEERSRNIITLEEAQQADHRRIVEIQTETTGIRKSTEKMQSEIEVTADRMRSLETRTDDLAASERERLDVQNAWLENQGLKMVEFEKAWKDWEKSFAAFEKRADEFSDRLSSYEKTYKELMLMRQELDETVNNLERRISEVGEMHRLSEERQKKDWSAFQSDDLKRWNTFKLSSDELWREHGRAHEKLKADIGGLNTRVEKGLGSLKDRMDSDLLHMKDMISLLREWATEIERAAR
jgi:chromosome segregation ATPase